MPVTQTHSWDSETESDELMGSRTISNIAACVVLGVFHEFQWRIYISLDSHHKFLDISIGFRGSKSFLLGGLRKTLFRRLQPGTTSITIQTTYSFTNAK